MIPSFLARCALLVGFVALATPGFGAERVPSDAPPAVTSANQSAPTNLSEAVRQVAGPGRTVLYDMATGSWSFVAEGGPMPTGEPVYVNAPPDDLVFPPGAGRLIADDVRTVAVGGCDVSGYEIRVGRSANWCSLTGQPCETDADCAGSQTCNPRPDSGFSVDLAMYDACPGAGGQVIAGTTATIDFADNGLFTILVNLSAAPIPMGSALWVSAEFNKTGAGWVVGTPASSGFTANAYHHPNFPCIANFGGTAIYAGFHARVFCTGEFEREFAAYVNLPGPADFTWSPGAFQWMADDVELIVNNCVLSSYEIASIGTAGPYSIEAAIWSACDLPTVIEGTQGTSQGVGNGSIELARFDFPGGVPLGSGAAYWVAWRYSNNTSAIVPGPPLVGSSGDFFGLPSAGGCGFSFGGNPYSAFAITVSCLSIAGDCCAPTGEPGCALSSACTTAVCAVDAWCCQVEWDVICADEARVHCSTFCPEGLIQFMDPPAGVIDARQPSGIDDATQRLGIDSINMVAPIDAGTCCWSLCETGIENSVNYITSVASNGDGTMTLDLARPITPGHVTTLTYTSTSGMRESFSLTAHPANVNGDGAATPSDILALIDGLNGVQTLPWGSYSCDLDHSGVCGPEDILRAIDLLNGSGVFTPWIDTPLPVDICP